MPTKYSKLRVLAKYPQDYFQQNAIGMTGKIALEIMYPFGQFSILKNTARYKQDEAGLLSQPSDLSPVYWMQGLEYRIYEFYFSRMNVENENNKMLFRKLLLGENNNLAPEQTIIIDTSADDTENFTIIDQPEIKTGPQLNIRLYLGNIGEEMNEDKYFEITF